jgi:hypothetical protein
MPSFIPGTGDVSRPWNPRSAPVIFQSLGVASSFLYTVEPSKWDDLNLGNTRPYTTTARF